MARGKKTAKELSLEEKLAQALVPVEEQPYKIPGNWYWTYLTIGFAECLDSFRKPINATERATRMGDIPYYGATGQVGWIDDFLTNEQLVLVGEDGAPFLDLLKDKAYMIEGKSWVNNHAHILRSYFGSVGNYYLMNYLNYFDFTGYVNGTTRLKLTQTNMSIIPIPVPPIKEQKRIVDCIKNVFAKLDEAKEKAIAVVDGFELRKSAILHKAFIGDLTVSWREKHGIKKESWQDVTLSDLIINGPQNGLYKSKNAYGSGTKILRIDGFYDGHVESWDSLKRLMLNNEEIELYQLNLDDIVVNRVNSMSYLGKSALIRDLPETCVFESNMMRISLDKEKVIPEYIIKYLNSADGLGELRKNAKQAVNQASINQQDVKNVIVKLPIIEEQIEITHILETLIAREQQGKKTAESVITRIVIMKKAVLARAFRGKMGTNDPTEESAIELLKSIL